MHDPPSHSLVRKKLPKPNPKPAKPSKPSFAPEVTRRGGGPGHPSPKPGHGAYMQHALERKTPNAYEEKIILGSKGYGKLQRLRQQRYKNEVKAQTRGHDFGDTITEGFIKGSLGAAHLALPIEMIPQAYQSFRHPVRRLTQGGEEVVPLPGGFGGKSPELPAASEFLSAGKKAYKKTVPLRSAELGGRFQKAAAAGAQAGHGEAGYYAELGQMKGKLPFVSFDELKQGHVSQEKFDALMTRIATHPGLQQGEKLNGRRALMEARDFGKPPPPHAQLIWQKAFGDARARKMTPPDRHFLFDLATLPRSVMSTADLSGILRQGLLAAHEEPILAAKAARAQVKFFRSKDAFERSQHEIMQRPNYERMLEGKLSLTDIGGDLVNREEAFSSQITKHVPIMAGSARAYIGGLNKLRADMFDKQIEQAGRKGYDINNPKLLRGISKQINSATGRGDYGPTANRYAATGNALFFSPRLIKSRLDYLNPHWYYKLHPLARKQAIKGVTRLAATMAGILYTAHVAHAKLQGDPRSADFGKIRYGNLRFDPFGGFQQYVRAGSQIASGKMISTTTGKTETLGSKFGEPTGLDIALHFGESKLAPVPSFVVDALNRHGYAGQHFNLPQEVYSRMIPLLWQDVYSTYKDKGSAGLAALVYGIGGVGVGVQDYAPRKPKRKNLGGGRSGGPSSGSLLRRGGSGGSSSMLRP